MLEQENPVRAAFTRNYTGLSTDGNYLVLPATAILACPRALQQQLAHVLAYAQTATADQPWPRYAVQPHVSARVADLDAEQCARIGLDRDDDATGHVAYRWRATGELVTDPERDQVCVPVADPLLDTEAI